MVCWHCADSQITNAARERSPRINPQAQCCFPYAGGCDVELDPGDHANLCGSCDHRRCFKHSSGPHGVRMVKFGPVGNCTHCPAQTSLACRVVPVPYCCSPDNCVDRSAGWQDECPTCMHSPCPAHVYGPARVCWHCWQASRSIARAPRSSLDNDYHMEFTRFRTRRAEGEP